MTSMNFLLRLLLVLLPVGYYALARHDTARFRGEAAREPSARSRRLLAAGVLGAHALLLAVMAATNGLFARTPGADAATLLALSLAAIYLWVEMRTRAHHLGVFVFCAAFAVQLLASVAALGPATVPTTARGPLWTVHIATIVLATATLLLSGCFGLIYLTLDRQMRRQTFGLLYGRLPNLGDLAAMNRGAASIGFVFMTVGLNLGIWLAHDSAAPGFSYRDPKVVATLALWVLFGVIALSRWVRFLTGRRAAVAASWGLGLVVITWLISVLPGITFHKFT